MAKSIKIKKKAALKKIELSENDLQQLAHAGTKEAIAKLEAYLEKAEDENARFAAQMALDECELFYYAPRDEKEEREYLLAKLVLDHERQIIGLEMDLEKYGARVDKFRLEQEVHKKVIASYKDKKEDWQYNYIDEAMSREFSILAEIESQIEYEKAWVAAAKKMIKTPRYKNVPGRYFDHISFDFEDEDQNEEEYESEDDLGCDCGCEEDYCDCGDENCDCGGSDEIEPETIQKAPF